MKERKKKEPVYTNPSASEGEGKKRTASFRYCGYINSGKKEEENPH